MQITHPLGLSMIMKTTKWGLSTKIYKVYSSIFANCVSIWLIFWTLQWFSSTPPCNLINSHFPLSSHFLLDIFGVPNICWWILMILVWYALIHIDIPYDQFVPRLDPYLIDIWFFEKIWWDNFNLFKSRRVAPHGGMIFHDSLCREYETRVKRRCFIRILTWDRQQPSNTLTDAKKD